MGVTFGTPVDLVIATSMTSMQFSMSGVSSGQPILVVAFGNPYGGVDTSTYTISDNFSTPYTWTQVDHAVEGSNASITTWIGTGGAGTAGTVTVKGVSSISYIGGSCISCVGASTASGLSAVDVHTHSAGSSTSVSVSVTASSSNEGIWAATFAQANLNTPPSSPWVNTYIGAYPAAVATYASPPAGTLETAAWNLTPTANWVTTALIVKEQVYTVPLRVISQAVNRASRY